jgi:hypothetical protein
MGSVEWNGALFMLLAQYEGFRETGFTIGIVLASSCCAYTAARHAPSVQIFRKAIFSTVRYVLLQGDLL